MALIHATGRTADIPAIGRRGLVVVAMSEGAGEYVVTIHRIAGGEYMGAPHCVARATDYDDALRQYGIAVNMIRDA